LEALGERFEHYGPAMGMDTAPILVADPDDAHREFVGDALARGGFRTVSVATGAAALAAARAEQPQLAVLEVRLGDLSGYEICRALREQLGSAVGIVFVSGDRTEPSDRVAGLLLGADDYLAKPLTADELLARVRAVVRRTGAGRQPVGYRVAATAGHRVDHLRSAEGAGELTPREREVLGLLADGLEQRDIANTLYIAHKTVGKHIEHILRKLSAPNRAAAVAIAYQCGLAPQTLRHAS
jgi:two-component system OmpR family response regulator